MLAKSLSKQQNPLVLILRCTCLDYNRLPNFSSYDIALLYLKQADYNLDVAVEAYISDEKWEREHPIESSSKNNPKPMKKFGLNTGLTGQI